MSKKITFAGKPAPKPVATPEQWVENRTTESMKRLTFDISESLHRRIKSQCANNGVKMTDALRELLERHFPQTD